MFDNLQQPQTFHNPRETFNSTRLNHLILDKTLSIFSKAIDYFPNFDNPLPTFDTPREYSTVFDNLLPTFDNPREYSTLFDNTLQLLTILENIQQYSIMHYKRLTIL